VGEGVGHPLGEVAEEVQVQKAAEAAEERPSQEEGAVEKRRKERHQWHQQRHRSIVDNMPYTLQIHRTEHMDPGQGALHNTQHIDSSDSSP
jgi:hypothetical protein